jgi:hypothetical protein
LGFIGLPRDRPDEVRSGTPLETSEKKEKNKRRLEYHLVRLLRHMQPISARGEREEKDKRKKETGASNLRMKHTYLVQRLPAEVRSDGTSTEEKEERRGKTGTENGQNEEKRRREKSQKDQ